MYISHLVIKNLRALEDIDCELSRRINVIVGPNAVGKTTILQACRLSKALLAPRTQQEIQQVLVSLGAASPHFPQRVFLNSLARDLSRQIEIRCTYVLTDDEISVLRGGPSDSTKYRRLKVRAVIFKSRDIDSLYAIARWPKGTRSNPV